MAIMRVLEAPRRVVRNQIFNVGSNEQNFTIRQIGHLIQKHVPAARIIKKGDDIDPRNYWVNFSKISRNLDYKPLWTIDQGVEQVIDAIRSGKVYDYRDAKYSNVKFLTEEGIFRLYRNENGWAYHLLNETSAGASVVLDL